MENIGITFSEIPYAEILENFIPDDATCISVKVNIPDYDPSDNNFVPPCFPSIVQYLKDSGVEVLALSSGIHLKGRHQVPHVHYHFIAKQYREPTNASLHRKRWLSKKGNEWADFDNLSVRYSKLEANKPKYQFLSYPLKEGIELLKRHYLYDGNVMERPMKNFLKEVGRAIYDTQVALHMRQQKCQERKQLALKELFELCCKNVNSFTTFKGMMLWLDDNYINDLEIEEMPDPKNYKVNCQKVAVKLNLLKYSDL